MKYVNSYISLDSSGWIRLAECQSRCSRVHLQAQRVDLHLLIRWEFSPCVEYKTGVPGGACDRQRFCGTRGVTLPSTIYAMALAGIPD